MSEPNHTNEQGTGSFGDKVLEALGTALGFGLFLRSGYFGISTGTRASASSTGCSESGEQPGSSCALRADHPQPWMAQELCHPMHLAVES